MFSVLEVYDAIDPRKIVGVRRYLPLTKSRIARAVVSGSSRNPMWPLFSGHTIRACGCPSASSSAAPSSVSTAAAESPASSAAASAVVDNAAENGSDALDGVFNALLEADPISNQFEIAAMNIEYDFGLKAEDVVSYKGVKSNDNGDAGLVLVLEAADGKAEDVANQLASYQQDQVAFYGNYAEFAQALDNVENAVIAFKGNTVVMVIASNECTADLDSAVDSALAD